MKNIYFTSFLLLLSCITQAQNAPHQTEFSTYAPAGDLPMVDLSTGNFRLNLPVLEIPGPEGNFELPLHYRAGIGLNQEASWVGLGWSMNAGAITRTLNQFPDDANGEPTVIINKNPGRRGWYLRQGILNMGWDSQEGHVGSVDIGVASVGWKNGLNSGSIAGFGVQDGEGFKFNVQQFLTTALTVATAGTAGSISAGMSKAAAIGVEVAFSAGVGISAAQFANSLHKPSSQAGGFTRVAQRFQDRGWGSWSHTNYWIFIDNSNTQKMYGSLYFHNLGAGANPNAPERAYGPNVYKGSATNAEKAAVFYVNDRPTNNGTSYRMEVSADVTLPVNPSTSYSYNSTRPLGVAHDAFTVLAPSIGGSIRPFRLDVGSVAFPRQMSTNHLKYNLVPFAQTKPDFIYEGSATNTYEYPQGTGDNKGRLGVSERWTNEGVLTLDDPLLHDATKRIAADRYGLSGGRLVQGRQVDWFTNEDIAQAGAAAPAAQGKFLDFAAPESQEVNQRVLLGYTNPCGTEKLCDEEPVPQYEDHWVTVPNRFRAGLPAKGIGAFVITAEDGMRYHFALPVYHYSQHSKSWNTGTPAEFTSEKMGLTNSGYAYATAWLLTAITGPDFVDKGVKGVLDAADEGRWVKFEYGKFSAQFSWRTPYRGNAKVDNGAEFLADGTTRAPVYEAYAEGYKETYYLNSIATRSHTALFIKDVRQDGRGYYSGLSTRNADLGTDEKEPASSLQLSEIILLTNEDYQYLQATYGFGTNTAGNATARNAAQLGAHDSFEKVFDTGDLAANPAVRSFVQQKLRKRIVFNYSYRLCPKMTNSFASAKAAPPAGTGVNPEVLKGKLTLESIAILGPNNAKLIPDFKFEYGFNPAYEEHKYDAYGFYKRERTQNGSLYVNNDMRPVNAAGQTQASEDGSAWSLKRLHNPLGSTLEVSYERDQYGAVSGIGTGLRAFTDKGSSAPSGTFTLSGSGTALNSDLRAHYRVDDMVHVKGNLINRYKVSTGSPSGGYKTVYCATPYEGDHPIVDVTATTIKINYPPTAFGAPYPGGPIPDVPVHCSDPTAPVSPSNYDGFDSFDVQLAYPETKNGGDIRVAKLVVRDENGNAYETRYTYSTCSPQSCTPTGVMSKEPEKAKYVDNEQLANPDYPTTPVLYREVTELSGPFVNAAGTPDAAAFDTRTVYRFHTPRPAMVSHAVSDKAYVSTNSANYPFYNRPYVTSSGTTTTITESVKVGLTMTNNLTTINTALIGQPSAVSSYNKKGTKEQETVYDYSNDIANDAAVEHQGYFTEGTLLSEIMDDGNNTARYSLNKTIRTVIPTYLTGTTTTVSGVRAQSKTLSYDFLTAIPLSSQQVNSLGARYTTVQTPAYKIAAYSSMGPLGLGVANRNMLTQMAASTSYKDNGTASPTVLAAGIQTWSSTWSNPRVYDPATDRYQPDPAAQTPVWRQHRAYGWQSPYLNPDGTFANFMAYRWGSTTQAANWLNAGEVTLYDQYSQALESKNLNGQFAAQKTGADRRQAVAAASNARYTEIAYSGAEDNLPMGSVQHFGGEVRDGGRQSRGQTHTGQFSSLLTVAYPRGFTYQTLVGNANDLSTGRTYRASVWVHESDADGSARLYITLNGVTKETSRLTAPVRRAGKWYLLNLDIDLPATTTGQQLTVGCRRAGTSDVYVDDFRFQPLDAPLQASVYDPITRLLTYSLDNDNLFTHYEYDAAGKVIKVSKEVLTPAGSTAPAERVVRESAYNYARMREPTWVRTSLVECEPNADGSPTGYRRYQRQDMNASSPTYQQFDWEHAEYTAECPPCTGNLMKWIKGQCEYPTKLGCVSSQFYRYGPNCTPIYRNYYNFKYSDDTTASGYVDEANPCMTPSNSIPQCQ